VLAVNDVDGDDVSQSLSAPMIFTLVSTFLSLCPAFLPVAYKSMTVSLSEALNGILNW